LRKHIPVLVFLITATIALTWPIAAYRTGAEANLLRFERFADAAVDRIVRRIGEHVSLLHATRAMFEARAGNVSYAEFSTFIRSVDLERDYNGVQGIGYAQLLLTGDEVLAENKLLTSYNIDKDVFPQTDQPVRTVIVMLEPADARNRAALGFDMYAEEVRRNAMTEAAASGEARASGKVQLVQEIDNQPQPGFLVYIPFNSGQSEPAGKVPGSRAGLRGFVYAPFRAHDLLNAALMRSTELPLLVKVYDGEVQTDNLMFDSGGDPGNFGRAYTVEREVEIAGRNWTLVMSPSQKFKEGPEKGIALLLGAVSLLAAAALAASLRSQMKAVAASREAFRVKARAANEKDLLLQEMKHRIKNSIARVLAIARQTANQSESVDDFMNSFGSRLQAMATSQDLLTRSRDETVQLVKLLEGELVQVFGDGFENYRPSGEDVQLGMKATQALGLVFHELATNAMKYADMAKEGNRIEVNWRMEGQGKERVLVVDWSEETDAAVNEKQGDAGFGTRLLSSLVESELGGSIRREMEPGGLKVVLRVPADELSR